MKIFLVIIFIILSIKELSSQTYLYSTLHQDISIKIDSIFYKFEYPKIPEEMKKLSFGRTKIGLSDIQIATYIIVDTNNKVKHIDFFPLIGLHNTIPANHKVWSEVKKSIIKASKNWIFKPIKWKIPEEWLNKQTKDSLIRRDILLKEKVKPFGGRQTHLVIFSFHHEFDHFDFNFLYLIKVSE